MTQAVEKISLYDRDFFLWTEDTVAKLRLGNFQGVDLEHVIEEIEALGISQKKELLSRLIILLEHLVKRLYIPLPNDYNGWERTIREQRRGIRVLLDQMPSLRNFWDGFFDKAWNFALKDLQAEYPHIQFPREWQFSRDMEVMLDRVFWDN